MSKHPINLAVRFALEVGAILTFGIWGFSLSELWTRYLLVILLPLGFALLWGIFAVLNDPSRSGKTVVPTPGLIRLILELALFGSAVWMLFDLEHRTLGWIFGASVFVHYVISYDRIGWLLKRK
jgi:hypothetical protein